MAKRASFGRLAACEPDLGGLLLVPQFTLAADTRKGTRAGFSAAAEPEHAQSLYAQLVQRAREAYAVDAMGGNYRADSIILEASGGTQEK